jgi:hypothetical protein
MFQVDWEDSALQELAQLWMQADSVLRQTITAATHQIDQRLQDDPSNEGESREQGERVLFSFPLGIRFDGDLVQNRVRVLWVWSFQRRR